jgi:Uma2 family endonuclease
MFEAATIIEHYAPSEPLSDMLKRFVGEHEHLLFVEGTEDDFYAIEERKADYIEGIITMHSPASLEHEEIFGNVYTEMRLHVRRNSLGTVLGSRSLVVFSPIHKFEPDVMFIAAHNGGTWLKGNREFHGVPEVVVEILSKSTRHYDLDTKRPLYRAHGVGEICFVDYERKEIIIDSLEGTAYQTAIVSNGTYTSRMIPGFVWDAAALL